MSDQTAAPVSVEELLKRRSPRIPVTIGLIAGNVIAFAALLYAGAGLGHTSTGVQLAWGANFGPATQDGEWWRLVSALFMHFGVLHLAMNMWALWDGARLVERLLGHWRFTLLYFSAGIGGNLLSLVVQGQRAVSGGSSGAIFGVYAALLVCLWRERHSIDAAEFRLLFRMAAGFSIGMLALGFFIPGIDQAAHGGGFIFGALAAQILSPAGSAPRLRMLAAVALSAMVASLLLVLPPPAYRWHEERAARREIGEFLRDDAAIRRAWEGIRRDGAAGASFDEIAGRIEREIALPYENSFEELSQLHIDPGAPSAARLAALRRYAEARRDSARMLAEQLRDDAARSGKDSGAGGMSSR